MRNIFCLAIALICVLILGGCMTVKNTAETTSIAAYRYSAGTISSLAQDAVITGGTLLAFDKRIEKNFW